MVAFEQGNQMVVMDRDGHEAALVSAQRGALASYWF